MGKVVFYQTKWKVAMTLVSIFGFSPRISDSYKAVGKKGGQLMILEGRDDQPRFEPAPPA